MIFIEHASFDDATLKDNLGGPEYSYAFVKKAFRRVLERLGKRVDVTDPVREVDPIFHAAKAQGEDCVFLSYNPPHRTILGLACPTIPVFAWEYDAMPDETWDADPRNDWRYVLSRTGLALTHCRSAADVVRRSMGQDYPIWVAPAPLFDTFAAKRTEARGWREPFALTLEGAVAIDAGDVDLSLFRPEASYAEATLALRLLGHAGAAPGRAPQTLRLEGVVYTAVLCPTDWRKNFRDMLVGFVWAFRNQAKATLVLKLTHALIADGMIDVLRELSTLGAFECRIILVHGLLSNEAYGALIEATSYAVNTSRGEGQCLPLMEYMSCGRPAVAPAHSAMADYMTPENGFVVSSEPRPTNWPQDERVAMRCHHQEISVADLVRQYRESYRVAAEAPKRYAQLSEAAANSARAFCSEEVVTARLMDMLAWLKSSAAAARRTA